MKKNYIILISIFAGLVGIFLIIVGIITRGQGGIEEVGTKRPAERPTGLGPLVTKELGLEDLEGPKGLTEPPGARKEAEKKEKEYTLEEIPADEARQFEVMPRAELPEGAQEEGGTAAHPAEEASKGEREFNLQPSADKLEEMKTRGVVIY